MHMRMMDCVMKSCINSGKIESYRLDSKETTLICGAIEQYAKNVNVIEI